MKEEKSQSILQKYEHLYANKVYKLEETDNFLEEYSPPKMNQKETEWTDH